MWELFIAVAICSLVLTGLRIDTWTKTRFKSRRVVMEIVYIYFLYFIFLSAVCMIITYLLKGIS